MKSTAPWTRSVALLSHVNMNPAVLLASAFLLAAFFTYMYRQKRQEYLLVWSLAWLLIAAHFVAVAIPWHSRSPEWLETLAERLRAFTPDVRSRSAWELPLPPRPPYGPSLFREAGFHCNWERPSP